MFTGLIDDVGSIEQVATTPAGREYRIRCGYADLRAGESIALDGACLTVRECMEGWFTAAAVTTSLARTTLGSWTVGRRVNLERALKAGDRLGGHLVQGHVDDVATVAGMHAVGDARVVDLAVPAWIADLAVPHGSIAVDGVSLTVNELPAPNVVQLALIEYTLRHTTLGALRVGQQVNIEADVIGKYVQRMAEPYLERSLSEVPRMHT